MAPCFDHLPLHRRLIGFLEAALDCLEEAIEVDNTLRVLPHWAYGQVRAMAAELAELFAHLEREAPVLDPLHDEEVMDDDEGGGGACP
jgi:hypothetical protein